MKPRAVLSRRLLARRRARARARNAGAVMFIVAVTLGLLAAMGVYGLSSTASDIRAAGHMREALQGQRAGEQAFTMTAEALNPADAQLIYQQMMGGLGGGQTTNCKTSAPFTGDTDKKYAEACKRLLPAEMKILQLNANAWVSEPFTDKSFGSVANLPVAPAPLGPFMTIELTNPIDSIVAGNSSQKFAQITATVFVEIKPSAAVPAESLVAGRGRMTIGPIAAPVQKF